MKILLIFITISISSISCVSMTVLSLLNTKEDPIHEESTTIDETEHSDKLGLNISGLSGIGWMDISSEAKNPKNILVTQQSDLTFPAYNLSVSYQILEDLTPLKGVGLDIGLNMELGLGYIYNTIKFITTELSDDSLYQEKHSKLKIHQLSLDLLITKYYKSFCIYIGASLFPFIKVESLPRADTPKIAKGGMLGVRYNLYSSINLLFQVSYESSLFSVSTKDEKNQDVDQDYYFIDIMLGVGFSI